MDKDRHVSKETISAQVDVSVGTVHTIIARNWRCRRFPRSLSQGCSEKIKKKDAVMTAGRWSVELINSGPAVLDALVTCDESWIYCCNQETKRQSSQWKNACSPRPKKARQSKSTLQLLMIPFLTARACLHALGSQWTVNNEYYVEVLREFRKRFRQKRPALFKSGQWHFHLDDAQLDNGSVDISCWTMHNSILVTDYLTKMDIKTVPHRPYYPDLAPCDFW